MIIWSTCSQLQPLLSAVDASMEATSDAPSLPSSLRSQFSVALKFFLTFSLKLYKYLLAAICGNLFQNYAFPSIQVTSAFQCELHLVSPLTIMAKFTIS